MTPIVASVASADGTSDYPVAVPSGTTDGDLLIGVVASDWGNFNGNSLPTASWTRLATSDFDGGTNAIHVALYFRIASSEPATYTVGVNGGADSVAAILRVTGAESTPTIAEVAPTTTNNGLDAPSITPNDVDDLLLTFHCTETSGGGSINWTPPAGMTEEIDRQSTTWTSLLVASLADPSSPSGVKQASGVLADNGAGCTISIAAASGEVVPEVASSIDLAVDLVPSTTSEHDVGSSISISVDLAPETEATHNVGSSISLSTALNPEAEAIHEVGAEIALAANLAPLSATSHDVGAAIELETSLSPTSQVVHEAGSTIDLVVAIAPIAEAPALTPEVSASIDLALGIAPIAETSHSAEASIDLAVALDPVTVAPSGGVPEVASAIELGLTVSGTTEATHDVQALLPISLAVAPRTETVHEVGASVDMGITIAPVSGVQQIFEILSVVLKPRGFAAGLKKIWYGDLSKKSWRSK